MQAFGEEVFNSRFGQRRLQNNLAQRVDSAERIVVDGLRHPEDWAFLRETMGVRGRSRAHLRRGGYSQAAIHGGKWRIEQ